MFTANNDFFVSKRNLQQWIGQKSSEWKINLYINYGESYSPEVIEQTKLIDEYTPKGTNVFHIYDTSCHIMMELAGEESNGIFDNFDVEKLAKAAFLQAHFDANVSLEANLSVSQENSMEELRFEICCSLEKKEEFFQLKDTKNF